MKPKLLPDAGRGISLQSTPLCEAAPPGHPQEAWYPLHPAHPPSLRAFPAKPEPQFPHFWGGALTLRSQVLIHNRPPEPHSRDSQSNTTQELGAPGAWCPSFSLQSSKVLAKKELLYVPLIGWTWYFLEIVFCKRKWEEDRDTVIEGLRRLSDYPEYMWFLLYCEGTRFTETKHRVSMEVAAAKGLPVLKYHLLPRTKGFTTAVKCLRGTVAAVYDVTLNFRGNKNPSLLGILYGKKYEADMCVRRFPLEEIPLDEKEAAQWLHKLYQEKDALQEMYNQQGMFPGEQFKPARRPWTLLNFLSWATILLSPLFSFVLGVFASGSPLLILTFLGFVGAASFGVRRLIGVTEIEKGSSYGNQEFKKKE
uniref:1-acylglycerol-3-phosphate O-acyltransferase 3 n=2 Tax=Piliocolobus tephrosceles TaxID=591936 RepID=A0A8C9GWE3_9PRIM